MNLPQFFLGWGDKGVKKRRTKKTKNALDFPENFIVMKGDENHKIIAFLTT